MDNILDRVIQNYHFFTRSENKVADYILKAKQEIQSMTISELAANCGVAEATVTRFCRSLGCKGFHDFKMAVALAVLSPEGGSASERYGMCGEVHAEDSIEEKCRKLCYIGTEALQQTCTLIEPVQRSTASFRPGASTVSGRATPLLLRWRRGAGSHRSPTNSIGFPMCTCRLIPLPCLARRT